MFATDVPQTTGADLLPFDREALTVPEAGLGLAGMPAGAGLAAAVAGLDVGGLGDDEVVEYLQATDRVVSWAQALRARAVVAVAERCEVPEFAHLEVGVALRWSRRAAESAVGSAWQVVRRVPQVWDLLAAGMIDWGRARVVVDGVGHLPDEVAREVVAKLADAAPGLTAGQLRARLARLVVDMDPDGADTRHHETVEYRRVVAYPGPDGTGTIVASDLAADRVAAAMGHLDHLARHLRRTGDDRTMDQLRADVLLDLVSGACVHHPTRRAVASITLDLATARGEADCAGDIPGWGPVPPTVARRILTDDHPFQWRILGPTGTTHSEPTQSRRPTTAQRRLVETRHPTCVFPGCRMSAGSADLDHTRAVHHGGPTSIDNLTPLCRHHHRAKHQAGWTYQVTNDLVTWTSPLGHRYTTIRPP
jgi:hypothetical protein